MKIQCKGCGSDILAKDIDLQTILAKCRSCDSVFSVSNQITNHKLEVEDPKYGYSGPIKYPEHLSKEIIGSELIIHYSWFRFANILVLAIAIGLNYAFQPLFWGMLFSGQFFSAFIMSAHLAAGFYLLYVSITGLVNKTKIIASRTQLKIHHGPIPNFKSRDIHVEDIEQLYCKSKRIKAKNGYTYLYEVCVVFKDQTHLTLIPNLEEKDQAQYIEYEVEKFLGIIDRRVDSEVSKK